MSDQRRWGITTKTGVVGPYSTWTQARAVAARDVDVVEWEFEDAPQLERHPIERSTVHPATQWAPGSVVAVENGCTCDPGVVTTFGSRDYGPPVAFDAADIYCDEIIDPGCRFHGDRLSEQERA